MQDPMEGDGVGGLDDDLVDAGFKSFCSGARFSVRGQGDDALMSKPLRFGLCANGTGCFQAVHDRHLKVHQDDVGRVPLPLCNRIFAIDGGDHIVPKPFHQFWATIKFRALSSTTST